MDNPIGFVDGVQRVHGPGLSLTPAAMARMDNHWLTSQSIPHVTAGASAFHCLHLRPFSLGWSRLAQAEQIDWRRPGNVVLTISLSTEPNHPLLVCVRIFCCYVDRPQ